MADDKYWIERFDKEIKSAKESGKDTVVLSYSPEIGKKQIGKALDKICEKLGTAGNNFVKKLELKGQNINDAAVKKLVAMLKKSQIEQIFLSENQITDVGAKEFQQFANNETSAMKLKLHTVDLKKNNISPSLEQTIDDLFYKKRDKVNPELNIILNNLQKAANSRMNSPRNGFDDNLNENDEFDENNENAENKADLVRTKKDVEEIMEKKIAEMMEGKEKQVQKSVKVLKSKIADLENSLKKVTTKQEQQLAGNMGSFQAAFEKLQRLIAEGMSSTGQANDPNFSKYQFEKKQLEDKHALQKRQLEETQLLEMLQLEEKWMKENPK